MTHSDQKARTADRALCYFEHPLREINYLDLASNFLLTVTYEVSASVLAQASFKLSPLQPKALSVMTNCMEHTVKDDLM